eukprot:6180462-Amphidinium_carterae.1
MSEEVILVQETFTVSGSVRKAAFEAKACGYYGFFVPTLKASKGRPQGGLAILSKVATPAVVPHGGTHYLKGRWVHVIVSLEMGGRTLHVFNVDAYDVSYPNSCELNRSILDEMLPPCARSAGSPLCHLTFLRQAWFLISPHMRDSAGAEFRMDCQPNHYALRPHVYNQSTLRRGAWDCWNGAAVAALGLQPGDRGPLKVKWSVSPELQLKRLSDPARPPEKVRPIEQAWYQVQEEAVPLAHWTSAAGTLSIRCSKCYERVDLALLEGSAEKAEFPIEALRLALDMYRGRRRILVNGAVSQPVVATPHIPARCGLAIQFDLLQCSYPVSSISLI